MFEHVGRTVPGRIHPYAAEESVPDPGKLSLPFSGARRVSAMTSCVLSLTHTGAA